MAWEAWEVAVVLAVTLGASLLTLFSGFGLGTLLLPAFALVFPLDAAVAATAVVHLANNLWKAALVGRWADRGAVLRFGGPAAVAAFAGAGALVLLRGEPLWAYHLGGPRSVTALGLVVGVLVAAFALFDLLPALRAWRVGPRHLVAGGLLAGFFGGLSGHQGALRSVFLTKLGLDARAYIATGTLCAVLVDVARLGVYAGGGVAGVADLDAAGGWLLAAAVVMAFLGAALGARFVGQATMEGVRVLVGVLLVVVGALLAAGLV